MSSPAPAVAVPSGAPAVRRRRAGLRLPWLSLALLGGFLLAGLLAPWIAPHDAETPNVARRALPPGEAVDGERYLLGTDGLGRDVLSRTLFGARISLVVGVCAVAIGGSLGTLLGLLAGFYGRGVDALITRLADLQLSLPFLILVIAIMAVLGGGLSKVILVLGLTSWITYARVVRGETLALRGRDYVLAARALGASDARLLRWHLLPNVSTSIIVIATFEVARAILSEASLSYLGLGVQPPTPTWGGMVADGRDFITTAWWIATLPGLAIAGTVLSINLLGDWLRDTLDPTRRVEAT